MTDAVREAFERWMSEDWKWPDAVAHRYGHYVLAQTESAWKAWQAALSEQPAHPAPVERVTLSERRITALHTADQLRAYGDARAAALAGVLRLVVGDAEMFCRAAHHSKADRHEAFEPCPIHARAVAALQEQKS